MFLLKLVEFLCYLVHASHLIERKAHNSTLLGYCLQNALSDPPYGVGDELEAAGFIEFLGSFDKTYVALIDKVG